MNELVGFEINGYEHDEDTVEGLAIRNEYDVYLMKMNPLKESFSCQQVIEEMELVE